MLSVCTGLSVVT